MSTPLTIHLELPDQQMTLNVPPYAVSMPLSELLAGEGIKLNTRCAHKGVCDGCRVQLLEGTLRNAQEQLISADDQPVTIRACLYRMIRGGTIKLRIPARSLLIETPKVQTDFSYNVTVGHAPLLPATRDRPLAVAVDIGTTTVVVLLLDLTTGRILARASDFNQQLPFGDNVLTRIHQCIDNPQQLTNQQRAVVQGNLAPLIDRVLNEADRRPDEIAGLTVAANTTMLHLLAGVDPGAMGVMPFTPTFIEHQQLTGPQIGLNWDWPVPIHLLPGASAYVGADICAGAYATGLIYSSQPTLLIDIGTNGEMIFKTEQHAIATATAAGPAFEGVGLACGMRAVNGAINYLQLDAEQGTVKYQQIGDGPVMGLCGSAYIDLLAEARRVGLLSPTGRYDFKAVPSMAPLADRSTGLLGLKIAEDPDGKPIVVTEADIAAILQAKAAIAAGIQTLLERCQIKPEQVHQVFVAGGFGMHMNIHNALACGLLRGFTLEQIRLVGNTSLAGAYLAALDRVLLDEIQACTRRLEILSLNNDPAFEMRYIEQMMIP